MSSDAYISHLSPIQIKNSKRDRTGGVVVQIPKRLFAGKLSETDRGIFRLYANLERSGVPMVFLLPYSAPSAHQLVEALHKDRRRTRSHSGPHYRDLFVRPDEFIYLPEELDARMETMWFMEFGFIPSIKGAQEFYQWTEFGVTKLSLAPESVENEKVLRAVYRTEVGTVSNRCVAESLARNGRRDEFNARNVFAFREKAHQIVLSGDMRAGVHAAAVHGFHVHGVRHRSTVVVDPEVLHLDRRENMLRQRVAA